MRHLVEIKPESTEQTIADQVKIALKNAIGMYQVSFEAFNSSAQTSRGERAAYAKDCLGQGKGLHDRVLPSELDKSDKGVRMQTA